MIVIAPRTSYQLEWRSALSLDAMKDFQNSCAAASLQRYV